MNFGKKVEESDVIHINYGIVDYDFAIFCWDEEMVMLVADSLERAIYIKSSMVKMEGMDFDVDF